MPSPYYDTSGREVLDISAEQIEEVPMAERIVTLIPLLISENFPYKYGELSTQRVNDWPEDKVKFIGSIVAKELAELEPPAAFTKQIVMRLYSLGVFPSYDYFENYKHFGSFTRFKGIIGVEQNQNIRDKTRNDAFANLTLPKMADLLIDRYNELIELPDGERYSGPLSKTIVTGIYQAGLAPNRGYLQRRYGGIAKLNEHLGYPDIAAWNEHDYIEYGAEVLKLNGLESLTHENIMALSVDRLGPSLQTITSRFAWRQFIALSYQELQNQLKHEQAHKTAVYDYYAHEFPSPDQDVSFAEKAQHRALRLLLDHYIPRDPSVPRLPDRLTANTVTNVINHIQKKSGATLADVEGMAITINVFDDLWPTPKPKRLPILADIKSPKTETEELTQERALRLLLTHYFPTLKGVPYLPSNITERTVQNVISRISRRNGLTREEIEAAATKLGVIDYLISKEPLALEPIRERRKTPVVRIANLQRGVK